MGIFNHRCDWYEAQKKRLFSNDCRLRFNSEAEYKDNEELGMDLACDRGLFFQRELSADKGSL